MSVTDFTFDIAGAYPEGTTVYAYLSSTQPAGAHAPVGDPVTSGTISGGAVTFSALTRGVNYSVWGLVAGNWKLYLFSTPPEEQVPIYEWEYGFLLENVVNVCDPRFGAVGDGVTDDTAAINLAIDYVNASTLPKVLYFPGRTFVVTDTLTPITAAFTTIKGEGRATTLSFSGTGGRFFQIGTADDSARWTSITGFSFECEDAPNDEHALYILNAPDWRVADIFMNNVAGPLELGTADGGAARGIWDGLTCVVRDDNTNQTDWWLLNHSSQCKFLNCHTRGGHFWPYDVNNDSAYVKINSIGGSDGAMFSNFVCFCEPVDIDTGEQTANGTLGKPYSLYLDGTVESINNLRFSKVGMDGSHKAAIYFRGDSTVDSNRLHMFDQFRFETASGRCVDYEVTGAGSNVTEIISFGQGRFVYGNEDAETPVTPFRFVGDGVLRGVTISGGVTISEKDNAPARDQIFEMGISDWTIDDPSILPGNPGDPLAVDYIVQTTADIGTYTCDINPDLTTSVGLIDHFAHAAPSRGRRVRTEPSYLRRIPLLVTSGRFTTSGAAATKYVLQPGSSDAVGPNAVAVGTSSIPFFTLDPEDVDLEGIPTQAMIRATISEAATPPAINALVGLYPLTISGGNWVLGTVVPGSEATLTTPGSQAFTTAEGAEFDLPAAGVYCLGYTLSGTPAASGVIAARLLARSIV